MYMLSTPAVYISGLFHCACVAFPEENVYTFGRGQYGQLGHGTFLFEVDLPKPLEHFSNSSIKHVACGENHTAVITSKQSLKLILLIMIQPGNLSSLKCLAIE